MKSPLLLYPHLFSAFHTPDSLGFSSRQRPEHPRPASTRLPNNRQHAACAAPSLHPTRFLPNKSPPSIPRPHSQAALFPTSQLPTPRPGAPGNSQPAIRPLRQFPTTPRQTLARIAAPTHLPPKSRTPPGIPKHKKRSRHCAGSAPNYLQVSTRSYLSRSESGSGSCSSPYC